MTKHVVVVEYGNKRKPRVYGPFDDYDSAMRYVFCWPDPQLCKRENYLRPHAKPEEFLRASVQEIRDFHANVEIRNSLVLDPTDLEAVIANAYEVFKKDFVVVRAKGTRVYQAYSSHRTDVWYKEEFILVMKG